MKKSIVLITLLAVSSLIASRQGVSIHKLNNGMEVLLVENKALPMVGVNVVVKTGSAYETYETSGMSHMLEHLLFNGTTSRTQRELYDDTDLIGGYNNANTGDYYTNYMMVMPAEHQIKGMEIQADMLFNSILPEDKFEKEKGIVLEEIAQSLSKPATEMEYNLSAEFYKGHALSLPTLGTYATIEHMSRDGVNHYYQSTYLPNNMILSAIGNFDSETMLKEINRIYGAAAPGSVFRPTDSILKTGMTRVSGNNLTPGAWLDRYYGGELNTLHQIYQLPTDKTEGFFSLLELGLKEQLNEIESGLKQKFPNVVESVELELHTSPIAAYIAFKVGMNDYDNPSTINDQLHDLLKGVKIRIPTATLASLATKEKTDFLRNSEKPHMFGIYNSYAFAVDGIDGVLDLPTEMTLSSAAKTLKKFRFKSEPAVIFHHASGEEDAASSGEVVTQLIQGPEQGMGLVVRQNTASELLAIHYLFKYKAAYESEFGQDAAKILHDCFGQRMKSPEKEELGKKFGLKFTVNDNPWIPMDNIYLHPDFGYIRVEGLAANLDEAIAFLNAEMNGFVPTQAEFEIAQGKFSRGMTHGGKDKAKDQFEALKDSVLYGAQVEEAAKELTYSSLLSFTKVYFEPNNRVVSAVSPQPTTLVAKQLLSGVSTSPSKEYALTEKAYQTPSSSFAIDTPGGGERSYLFWGFVKDIDPADKAAIKALSLLLSDKIIFDVREKQGMAYRMSATSNVRDNKVLFYITLGTRPQNTDVLVPQFPKLMSKEYLGDISETDVQKAINMYLGRMMFRRLSSVNQAYYLGTSLFFHDDMNEDQSQLNALKKVTLEDVNRVAAKYLSAENPISIVVR
jgi:predicted Zn-dependent peptidase